MAHTVGTAAIVKRLRTNTLISSVAVMGQLKNGSLDKSSLYTNFGLFLLSEFSEVSSTESLTNGS